MDNTKRHFGVVMDPIDSITPSKDTTFAMMLEIQRRGHRLSVIGQGDLYLEQGVARAQATAVTVTDDPEDWYTLGDSEDLALDTIDVVLMRKDPPFDMEYVYATYVLDVAERGGSLVVNRPQALRDLNEKVATALFPELTPPTLISRDMARLRAFAKREGHVVIKPLDGMGGRSIFTIRPGDRNLNVVTETLTDYGQRFAMAQTFVPEITDGDKRVLLVDGKPVPNMLARVPNAEDGRGNLVMGATADARPLGDVERHIADTVGPLLAERGVLFAGLDVIGDRLTEINVTSPTGVREIDRHFGSNIAGDLCDAIDRHLAAR
ncbi:MAG: glutathione synthase [Pseudomonadota bacterium]